MRLPSPKLISDCHFFQSGAVTVHGSAAIAPGVILQADLNAQIIIGAGVSIGAGSVIHAYGGVIEIESGVTLGMGVLILGQSRIGSNACIGAMTTVMEYSIGAAQMVAPGSLLGDRSHQVGLEAESVATGFSTAKPTVTANFEPTVAVVEFQETLSTANFYAASLQPDAIDPIADSHSQINSQPNSHLYSQASFQSRVNSQPDSQNNSQNNSQQISQDYLQPNSANNSQNNFQANSQVNSESNSQNHPVFNPSPHSSTFDPDYSLYRSPSLEPIHVEDIPHTSPFAANPFQENHPSLKRPATSYEKAPFQENHPSLNSGMYKFDYLNSQTQQIQNPPAQNSPAQNPAGNYPSNPAAHSPNSVVGNYPPPTANGYNPTSAGSASPPSHLVPQTSGSALVDRKITVYGKEQLQRMMGALFPHRQALNSQNHTDVNGRHDGMSTGG